MDQVVLSEQRNLPFDAVVALYKGNAWSSARVPEKLYAALRDSHTLISAWVGDKLVGLGNAISDGHLVVYYPHGSTYEPDRELMGIEQRASIR